MSEFETKDLDLAAAIMTTSGVEPDLEQHPPHDLITFSFPPTTETRNTVLAYASGNLTLNVRRLLNRRAWLYREVAAMKRGVRR